MTLTLTQFYAIMAMAGIGATWILIIVLSHAMDVYEKYQRWVKS